MRDSKDPTKKPLVFTPEMWIDFVQGIKDDALAPR